MTAAHRSTSLLRARDGNHARVSFAELFFDLVFVFAVTQLSHSLIAHHSLLGFVETGMLFLAMWWAWIYTAWATNWLDPERIEVRLLLFVLMAAGLVMGIAIPEAFGARGAVFAIGFTFMQLARPLFMLAALRRHDPVNFRNFIRIAIWSAASALLWIWGGFADPHARLWLWAAALAVDFSAAVLGFRLPVLGASRTTEWRIEGGHVAERCGLFVIIALGESVLITGATFSEAQWTPAVLAGFASAFVGTIAMWWIYFNVGAERASDQIAHDADPGRIARLAYTYLHIPIGAGIVLTAASDEMVLGHPHGHADALTVFALVGGPMLYLLGNLLFKRATVGWTPLSHSMGLWLLAGLWMGAEWLTPLTLSLGSTAVLVMVAAWETGSLGRRAS